MKFYQAVLEHEKSMNFVTTKGDNAESDSENKGNLIDSQSLVNLTLSAEIKLRSEIPGEHSSSLSLSLFVQTKYLNSSLLLISGTSALGNRQPTRVSSKPESNLLGHSQDSNERKSPRSSSFDGNVICSSQPPPNSHISKKHENCIAQLRKHSLPSDFRSWRKFFSHKYV